MAKIQNNSLVILTEGLESDIATGMVRVTVSDLSPDFLDAKIAEGQNVTTTVLNPGGVESVEIAAANLTDLIVVETASGVHAVTNEDIVRLTGGISGFVTIQRPAIVPRKTLTIVNDKSGNVTILVNLSTLDGSPSVLLAAGQTREIFPFSDEWNTI